MIKIEHVVLPSPEQMEFVIEGMRNPMNSWDKNDSNIDIDDYSLENIVIGPNDLSLMQKLSAAGTDHRKFMRMMPVMVRITAPLYWWKEFDTYKVGTVANSCSTMHKIADRQLYREDFSIEHLYTEEREAMEEIIKRLNSLRTLYLDGKRKEDWWQLIQLLPSSYNQTRNVMLNYEVLHNMYHSRKNHKLDEWVDFCKWMIDLPYFELITGTGAVTEEASEQYSQ